MTILLSFIVLSAVTFEIKAVSELARHGNYNL